ncbi:uncharacterized protein LOC111640269 [Centruroides sculpturatus]|uniref:uncharacterized protein LOC111640269 n=1 Tax=Centruroides sculpturatus TaxID=218467 RepID=UPI000C6CB3ED|nr:uncharacterized protein LOC111640269 [Centruroides sculpturatus]
MVQVDLQTKQITGEGTSKTFKISEQSEMHSSSEISAASSMREEHLKTYEKDKTLQFSQKLFQCHQCRFTTNSGKQWFLHKQTHVDEAHCTSKEQKETDAEVVRASEIILDMIKKRLETIKDKKKSPDPHTPPSSQ